MATPDVASGLEVARAQWAPYAAASLAAAAALAGGATLLLPAAEARGARVGALVAWVVQLGAFALLLSTRRQATWFVAAFAGGVVLRFAVVGVVAFWVTTRAGAPPAAATLVSLAGLLFLLLLLEPLFLRRRWKSS